MTSVAVYVAVTVALRHLTPPTPRLVAACVTAFTIAGFAMVVNDIYDIDVDRVNEPGRALPSGAISIRGAWVYALILAVVGLGLAAYDGVIELGLAGLSCALSILYSKTLKLRGLSGNLAVSYNVALPFLYGGLVVNKLSIVLATFFLLAFLSNTGREIIKGIAEAEGDALRSVRTLARVRGPRVAAKFGSAFSLIAVGLSPIPIFVGGLSPLGYLPVVFVTDILFVYLSVKLLMDVSSAQSVKNSISSRCFWLWCPLSRAHSSSPLGGEDDSVHNSAGDE
jgi:4-hydroxybenzoate polyprenyltransferase and related prenyltransferases